MKIPNDVAEKISDEVNTIIEVALLSYPKQDDEVEEFHKWLLAVCMTTYLKGWSEACKKELNNGILTKTHEFVKGFEKDVSKMVAGFGNIRKKSHLFRHRNDWTRDMES